MKSGRSTGKGSTGTEAHPEHPARRPWSEVRGSSREHWSGREDELADDGRDGGVR